MLLASLTLATLLSQPVQPNMLTIPTPAPNFDTEVLVPLRAVQAEEAEKVRLEAERIEAERLAAEAAARAAEQARLAALARARAQVVVRPTSFRGLLGTIGYARAGGNCVNEPGVNKAGGNPISWPVLYRTPRIGATVLFYFNHTAVVTGIWSNGDIEVRHQNVSGNIHRYPASAIRGYR